MATIQLEQLSKTFSKEGAFSLHPTSLTIESGTFVTILGASGSGKTTLLKLINRLYRPSGGRILINGADSAQIPETQLRLGMGYVIQQTGLFQHMSIARNIAVVPELLKWPPARIAARVDELLELVGLDPGEYKNRFPKQLSGGQQQRVGLARALAGDPDILLMDEPFGAVDNLVRQHLQTELLAIQSRLKKTIVFVTHDVQEAFRLGNRVMVMNEGRVLQYAPPVEILAHPADTFVRNLIGADDFYRQFDLLTAAQCVQIPKSGEDPGSPSVLASSSLNQVLEAMLRNHCERVNIVDERNCSVGMIDFETLQSLRSGIQESAGL